MEGESYRTRLPFAAQSPRRAWSSPTLETAEAGAQEGSDRDEVTRMASRSRSDRTDASGRLCSGSTGGLLRVGVGSFQRYRGRQQPCRKAGSRSSGGRREGLHSPGGGEGCDWVGAVSDTAKCEQDRKMEMADE